MRAGRQLRTGSDQARYGAESRLRLVSGLGDMNFGTGRGIAEEAEEVFLLDWSFQHGLDQVGSRDDRSAGRRRVGRLAVVLDLGVLRDAAEDRFDDGIATAFGGWCAGVIGKEDEGYVDVSPLILDEQDGAGSVVEDAEGFDFIVSEKL